LDPPVSTEALRMSGKLFELIILVGGIAMWAILLYCVRWIFLKRGKIISVWSAEGVLIGLILAGAIAFAILS